MVLLDRIKISKCRVFDEREKQVNPGKNREPKETLNPRRASPPKFEPWPNW